MVIDYISSLKKAIDLCDDFRRDILSLFQGQVKSEEQHIPYFVWLKPYLEYFEPVKGCVELCRILKPRFPLDSERAFFDAASSLASLEKTTNIKNFKINLRLLKACFSMISAEVSRICSSFDKEEKERINEAIHDYIQGCSYSCVAMSVSAVESRLLELMCLVNPDSEGELQKKTLGQLIYEYISDKDNYKNVVPEKHEPLLQLCNTYRTFSVHPKKHRITGRIANSILSLAIEFLIDRNTKPEVAKAKIVATKEGE